MAQYRYKKQLAALACCAALTFFYAACATGSAVYNGLDPKEAIPAMENLRQGTLANGMHYYIYENRKPENRAYLMLAVNAGAVLEDDDENGLAHFVEHMAFNGTERFSESEVVDYLRSLGMRFGADLNAFTTTDETVYEIEVPVETDGDGVKHIPVKALNIIEDWTCAVTFDGESVNDERRVIMEEYRLRRFGATGRQHKTLWTALLAGSRYAERDVIGLPEIIETAPAGRIKNFYNKWYRPENMAVIFAGDFDGEALEKSLASHFNASAGETPFNHPEYFLPPPEKNNIKVEVFTDPELLDTQTVLFYKQKYVKTENTIAEFREGLIDNLIGRILTERLDDASQKPQSPYIAAGSVFFNIARPARFYAFNLAAKPGMVEQALDEMLVLKESVKRYGFSPAEIDRAKRSLLADAAQSLVEKEKIESDFFVTKLMNHYLNNDPAPGADWEFAATEKLLPSITKNDLHKRVKSYLSYDDVVVFVSAPEAEAPYIPSKDAIVQKVKASGRLKIKNPEGAVIDSALLDKTPERGDITEEIIHKDTGIVEWKLGNGARVLLKNTTNKNDNIELFAVSRGGSAAAPLEDSVSAGLAAELLSASGAGRWSRGDLIKKLSGKQVSLSFNTSSFMRNIQGSSNNADLKTLFELLYLYFTDHSVEAGAVSVVTDEYRTILARRSEDPESVFFDEIQKITYGENPRFMPLTIDDLSMLDAGGALAFLEKCFNPADYTFVITGNIDLETMRDFVETYVASIPVKTEFNQWAQPVPPIRRPEKINTVIRKGKEDKGYVYSGRFLYKNFDGNTALVCNLLSEYLDIVLIESIREKLGGTYSISGAAIFSPVPPDGEIVLEAVFACDPKRAVELNGAVEAEFAKIAAGNINAGTFDKARKALIKNWEQSMESNVFLSRTLANYRVIFGIPEKRLYERPEAYEALHPDDMRNLMKQIMQREPVTVMLYPAP